MDKNQRINCTVCSCQFNNEQKQECQLDQIIVAPCSNCQSGNAEDESMCGSYKCSK